jgi:iron complex outermembrane receptor protein
VNLPSLGGFAQSLSLDGESMGYNDPRTGISNGHAFYRGAGPVGPGTLTIDADITFVRTLPGSPVVRQGLGLTTLTPLDANYNPANAHINENRYHAAVGYGVPVGAGTWQGTVSLAYSDISDVRGFLRPDLTNDGSQNADSQQQDRHIVDLYADTHYALQPAAALDVVTGADLLYGFARQESINGAYYAPLNGSAVPPPTTSLHVDEVNSISDRRVFAGQYVQADWKLSPAVDLNAGARLNETDEHLVSRHIDGFDAVNDLEGNSHGSIVRGTAAIGVSYAPLPGASRALILYANFRDSFKPSAIDFGPDYTPDVLRPERALSYEAGARGHVIGGLVQYGLEVFQLDFRNLVVATTGADGGPLLENAGGERLRGAEADLEIRPLRDLAVRLTASDHEARFTQYIATEAGANVNAGGKLLPLAPRVLLSAGAVYDPAEGLQASTTVSYVGRRFLDIANTAPVGAYATLDASLGYRFDRYEIAVTGTNLSDQRPPVTASEFGDSSFYLLPGRAVFVDVTARF